MKSINDILTPYGKGQLWDKMEDGRISVRLPVNELTLTIPKERYITMGEHEGLFAFYLGELS